MTDPIPPTRDEALALLADRPADGLMACAMLIRKFAQGATPGLWWSPPVALAVAELLDRHAANIKDWAVQAHGHPENQHDLTDTDEAVVAFARAWLTGEAQRG